MKVSNMPVPTPRVARPTDDIERLKSFYINGLGFEALSEFSDHDGFDGLMIGDPNAPFTLSSPHASVMLSDAPQRKTTSSSSTCLTRQDKTSWERAVLRMQRNGFDPVKSFNPFWDRSGRTFEDPDGYRVVLQNAAWG